MNYLKRSRGSFLLHVCLALTAAANFACTFEPNDVFQTNAKSNVTPSNVKVEGFDMTSDTIYLYSSRYFNLKLSTNSQQPICSALLTVNGQIQFQSSTYFEKNIVFDYASYPEGDYKVMLTTTVSKGTGSIADKVGKETVTSSKSWILHVDKSYRSRAKGQPVDGLLKLSWGKYADSDFKCYKVTCNNWIHMNGTLEIVKILDQEFCDSTYFGLSETYWVEVEKKNGELVPWGTINLPKQLPSFKFQATDNNEYLYTISGGPFYRAIKELNFIRYIGGSKEVIPVILNNEQEVTIKTNLIFGVEPSACFILIPQKIMRYNDITFSLRDLVVGIPFHNFRTIHNSGRNDLITIDDNGLMKRYSTTQGSVVESRKESPYSGVLFSPQGTLISSVTPINSTYNLINPASLSTISQYSLPNNNDALYSQNTSLTDVGTIVLDDNNNGFYIYDIAQSKIIASKHLDMPGRYWLTIKASHDGRYVMVQGDSVSLFRLDDGVLKKLWAKSDGEFNAIWYDFNPTDATQFYQQSKDETTITIRATESFGKLHEYTAGGIIASIDFYRNEYLCYRYGELSCSIRDFSTGEVKTEIKAMVNYTYMLFNHVIYSPYGVKYNIK